MSEARQLLERTTRKLVTALVDRKKAVVVEVIETPVAFMLGVGVDSSDVGKVIGGGGTTWRALRTILEQMARRQRVDNFTLELLPRPKVSGPVTPFQKVETWDGGPFEQLLAETMEAALGGVRVERVDVFADMSRFDVLTTEAEFDLTEFQRAAETVFHAIGKAQGKIVHVALAKVSESEMEETKAK